MPSDTKGFSSLARGAVVGVISTALIAAVPPLGTELRRDGYVIRPPRDFAMGRMDLVRGTRAGAVSSSPEATRALSAALVDRPGQDAAAMLISIVEGPLQATPAAREEFSAATVRHFAETLNLPWAMDRADLIGDAPARIEVTGHVRHQGQVRKVLVAGMAGKSSHAVVFFSVPTARWSELSPQIRASLDSFRSEGPSDRELPRGAAGAAAGALAGALLASIAIWRRRRRASRSAEAKISVEPTSEKEARRGPPA
jgi:hypothetical protein